MMVMKGLSQKDNLPNTRIKIGGSMSNKHFSLLVKTLELEEQLSNSKF